MEEKRYMKLDDSALENVSGGLIIMDTNVNNGARNALFTGEDKADAGYAVLSGDTKEDPLLLGGKNGSPQGVSHTITGNNKPPVNKNLGNNGFKSFGQEYKA